MKSYTNNNTARRYIAHVGTLGTSQIHLRNPYITAWWSAAFPGFGHFILSKYIRGYFLFIWEVVVNLQANLNLAIIYTFQGQFSMVKEVVDTRWLLAYMPVYLYGIWDSYRSAVDMNKVYLLADRENHRFNMLSINSLEVNCLDKRNPFMALFWSLFIPGLGHLYTHRMGTAFFIFFWTALFLYYSQVLEAVPLLFMGDMHLATAAVQDRWLLFLPSIYGFAAFDAHQNAAANNKLFEREQRNFLQDNYQRPNFKVKKMT
jgi:TM2 domain-containing membrane protein YozV